MCGITGYYALEESGSRPPDLGQMIERLRHRGPDDEGSFRAPGVALGMRRLSVIDLETGHQPIANESGEVVVVCNGEIYNFRELRRQLEAKGHRFTTASDTEVLVHGWEEWNEGLLGRLRGMFAFALWDGRDRRLVLARDPLGVKPLYLARAAGRLLFASEIKSLLVDPAVPRDLDLEALDQYLAFLYVPEPRTIYRGIRALSPGHLLVCRDGEATERRYWRFEPQEGRFASREEAVVAVREAFQDSVRAMLVSDVPLGLFLSAGVDSASILAVMAASAEGPVRTFSIGFGAAEHRWDEVEAAERLARQFDAEHHTFRVEPDIVALLPEVVRCFDQPFANPTAVILYLLARETRRHVTVALSGTGGDELFAGYPRYLGMRYYASYRRLPRAVRAAAGRLSGGVLRDATDGRTRSQRLRRFLESGALEFDAAYAAMLVSLDRERRRALYTPQIRRRLDGFDETGFVRRRLAANGSGGSRPDLERLLPTDLETYLPCNQLAYADRMSMAHSLEVRVPFVDQRMAEVAAGIPLAWHLDRGVTKGLFREAAAPLVPREILDAPKQGLNLPVSLWFRGRLLDWLRSLLSPERLEERGLFRPQAVAGLLDEHVAGRRDHSLFLWSLAVLEVWQQDRAAHREAA